MLFGSLGKTFIQGTLGSNSGPMEMALWWNRNKHMQVQSPAALGSGLQGSRFEDWINLLKVESQVPVIHTNVHTYIPDSNFHKWLKMCPQNCRWPTTGLEPCRTTLKKKSLSTGRIPDQLRFNQTQKDKTQGNGQDQGLCPYWELTSYFPICDHGEVNLPRAWSSLFAKWRDNIPVSKGLLWVVNETIYVENWLRVSL